MLGLHSYAREEEAEEEGEKEKNLSNVRIEGYAKHWR